MCVCVCGGGGGGGEGGKGAGVYCWLGREGDNCFVLCSCVVDSSGTEEQRWELAESN